ncbi:hypothetical protein BVX93_00010, partial [bacterium B13(2017)]
LREGALVSDRYNAFYGDTLVHSNFSGRGQPLSTRRDTFSFDESGVKTYVEGSLVTKQIDPATGRETSITLDQYLLDLTEAGDAANLSDYLVRLSSRNITIVDPVSGYDVWGRRLEAETRKHLAIEGRQTIAGAENYSLISAMTLDEQKTLWDTAEYEWIGVDIERSYAFDSKGNIKDSEVFHGIVNSEGIVRYDSGERLMKQYDPIKGYTRQQVSAKYKMLGVGENPDTYQRDYLQIESTAYYRHDFRGNGTETEAIYYEIYDSVAETTLSDDTLIVNTLREAMDVGVNEIETYDTVAHMQYGTRILSDHYNFKTQAKNQWIFEYSNREHSGFLVEDIVWTRGRRIENLFNTNGTINTSIEGNFMINTCNEIDPKNSDVTMLKARVTINHEYDHLRRNVSHLEEKVFVLDRS